MRDGTCACLQLAGIDVVGLAGNGADGLRLIAELRPDVLILDVRLPDMSGIEVARRVSTDFRDVRILIVTGYDDVGYVRALTALGIHGYLNKTAPARAIVTAVQAIMSGKTVIEPVSTWDTRNSVVEPLTRRELEVLRLLAAGRRNAEISEALGRSEKTIEYHLTHILEKLGVRSRAEAILKAQQYGLVPSSPISKTDSTTDRR